MTTADRVYFFGAALAAVLLAFVVFWGLNNPETAVGSVAAGNDYQATTTSAAGAGTTAIRTLKTGVSTLGSVVITGDNTGTLTVYNATTSDVTKRTGNKATSSIIIADFPGSAPEGTYTFDAEFTDGLLLVTSGSAPTSTVTWR